VRHPSLDERFDPAVRIVAYDPAWPEMAAAEIERVGAALGRVAVRTEHVGSTAVPGLAAKPIVDLQVSVAAIEPTARYVRLLEELGYLFAPDPESPDFHFFGKPAARPRTHHCMSARRAATTSSATWRCAITSAPTPRRRPATGS
jgi:GrpB-like predicted nucleotidyltransferase (UPF0157 family)